MFGKVRHTRQTQKLLSTSAAVAKNSQFNYDMRNIENF